MPQEFINTRIENTGDKEGIFYNLAHKADPAANVVDSHPHVSLVEHDAAANVLQHSVNTVNASASNEVLNTIEDSIYSPEGKPTPHRLQAMHNAMMNLTTVTRGQNNTRHINNHVWEIGHINPTTITYEDLERNAQDMDHRSHRLGLVGAATTVANQTTVESGKFVKSLEDEQSLDTTEVGRSDGAASILGIPTSRQLSNSIWQSQQLNARKNARARKSRKYAEKSARAYHAGKYRKAANNLARARKLSNTKAKNAKAIVSNAVKNVASHAKIIIAGVGAILAIFGIFLLIGIIASSTAASNNGSAANLEGNAQVVAAYLLDKGVDAMHVAAIMGCLSQETGDFDPTLGETASDAGGIGICQWPTNPSYGANPEGTRLMAYASSVGREWTDIYLQLDFMWCQLTGEESPYSPGISAYVSPSWLWAGYADSRNWRAEHGITGQASWNGFLDVQDIETAVGYFTYGYLRPADWAAKLDVRLNGDDAGHTGAMQYWALLLQGNGSGFADAGGIVTRAYGELGKPYVWGACGPASFDCSGLVSYCISGIYGNRLGDAETFYSTYIPVTDPMPGDICCTTTHCGIYIGAGQMIHAPHTGDVVKVGPVQSAMIYVRYPG